MKVFTTIAVLVAAVAAIPAELNVNVCLRLVSRVRPLVLICTRRLFARATANTVTMPLYVAALVSTAAGMALLDGAPKLNHQVRFAFKSK